MPKKIEKIFEREYGVGKGRNIYYRWANKHKFDYCPHCHKRREHIKHSGIKMCKTCGYQERY